MSEDAGNAPQDLRSRTVSFALRIIKVAGAGPKSLTGRVLAGQVLRSGTNPGAMCRAASRARSDAEFITNLETALQELDETAYWLELRVKGGTLSAKRLSPLQAECHGLIAIFTTTVKRRKRRD